MTYAQLTIAPTTTGAPAGIARPTALRLRAILAALVVLLAVAVGLTIGLLHNDAGRAAIRSVNTPGLVYSSHSGPGLITSNAASGPLVYIWSSFQAP